MNNTMINKLESQFEFGNAKLESNDEHAWYFKAKDRDTNGYPEVEVKVEKDNNRVSFRNIGEEDWKECDYIDL